MKRYTLSLLEDHILELLSHELGDGSETAGYLLCSRSETEEEVRLLVNRVLPVEREHYSRREPLRLSIDSASYAWASKLALAKTQTVMLVHTHPKGPDSHSGQDDQEEPKLMDFLSSRIPKVIHGSCVISRGERLVARVWIDGKWRHVDRIRVVGKRWKFVDLDNSGSPIQEVFTRQVLAFGEPMQKLLHRLTVGVVGVGGTGSAVVEQLIRLGVGGLLLFDGDVFEKSNVTRVYGSALSDNGRAKVDIAEAHAARIGLGTIVYVIPEYITKELAARELRRCDVVFCCTDNRHRPRGILVQLTLRYLIPIIDLGAAIDSRDGEIRGVHARVTVLQPGEACLFCRKRISPDLIAAEGLDTEKRRVLAREGYAPELDTPDPAVIPLTSGAASEAVLEFMSRLSGFRGEYGEVTERIILAHTGEMRGNRQAPDPGCMCMQRQHWGAGDTSRFLGLSWP